MPYDFYGKFPKLMIFAVCQGLRWSHHNTFSGMNAKRVEVLHIADSYAIIEFIPDNFIFNLFPSFERFFNEYLICKGESPGRKVVHLGLA